MGSSPIGTTFAFIDWAASVCKRLLADTNVFGWPSGLRRWFKAPVSSGAWVRIPLRTLFFSFRLRTTLLCFPCPFVHIVRSYHGESTGSHPNSEVKHHWACSVLRWGTTRESQVMYVLLFGTPHVCRPLASLAILRSSQCAIGLVVKYFVANEVPRVRFPDGAFFLSLRLRLPKAK